MTQKEKLLLELKELQYDIALENGENPKQIVESDLAREAKHYTVADLEKEIECAKSDLEKAQQRNKVEKYFATPEGAAKKEVLEMQLDSYKRAALKLRDEYIAEAKALIEPILPENWSMDCSEVEFIHIRLTDPITGDEVFGHDFELRLRQTWDRKDDNYTYSVDANIGTMGGFNPLKDRKRVSLYKVFSDIVSNDKVIDKLLTIMTQASGSKWQTRENIREIQKQLENPF